MASACLWSTAIKKNIINQFRSQDESSRFIGKPTLHSIWSNVFQQPSRHEILPGNPILHTWNRLKDEGDDQTLLVLASILVFIDWDDWNNFLHLFADQHGQAKYRLPLGEDTAVTVLGDKGLNCCQIQNLFLPVTIVEGEDNLFQRGDRMPFEEKTFTTSPGASGTVTKVVVARGYFRDSSGNLNLQPRTLARKRFSYPEFYTSETAILKSLRENVLRHDHVLAHMATLAIGKADFSILSEFADKGDLEQFLHGNFHQYKSQLYRNRIIEEVSNIADAIRFLHENVRVKGHDRPCYHMDLKPANVLIFSPPRGSKNQDDPIGLWKIADFGVSVLHQAIGQAGSKTYPRRDPGTYQPPEIDDKLGQITYNTKGDVWSFGGILCAVLAFLLDGSKTVEVLTLRRTMTAVGGQETDFFYTIEHSSGAPTPVLKPAVSAWLKEVEESPPAEDWRSGLVEVIRECLDVRQDKRPSASNVRRRVFNLQTGADVERMRSASDAIGPNSFAQQPPAEPFQSSPDTKKSFFGFKRKHGRDKSLSVDPGLVSPHRSSLRSPQYPVAHPITPPSTEGVMNSSTSATYPGTFFSDSVATHVKLDPNGAHAVFVFPTHVQIFDYALDRSLQPQKSYFEPQQSRVTGSFTTFYTAGDYLILYDKSDQPTFKLLSTEASQTFYRLSESAGAFTHALKTALSANGDIVLMLMRTLQAPIFLTKEYRLNDSIMGQEIFETVSFNQTGTLLWACGAKHWFLWRVNTAWPEWLMQPRWGKIPPVQDWGSGLVDIFPFHNRTAFCLYDSKLKLMRIVDADRQNQDSSLISMEVSCAAISCHDDQLFFVRKESTNSGMWGKTQTHMVLCRRPVQGLKLGKENHLAYLPDMEAKGTFDIACRSEGSSQVLIVVSTQGKYHMIRLDSDGERHLT